ncbi:dipeptidyl aminopeptidase/acylaminoacyl peptidase [Sphingomonas vulcanisoli]|uniref:Dipeptidyl aminopeptidase/acylaminoacyl peptidase n=1 Tax=Sphingomonas vulcanisoli TaxID=1658060 RepID=A0ABX0TU93_9SPHN|nr:S9 family peptidase [Sphingomonas vulcanisoli]NIJ09091.1 dipeptidyl aminopeptidase/acylaminoacyl peptidase [Sphingomonas vulcanisoli]
MKKLLIAALLAAPAPLLARPFTPQDMVSLSRVNAPVVSPDGRWMVWSQRETDLAANKGRHDLWRLDLKAKAAAPEKYASLPSAEESSPQFGPDGSLYFLSDRAGGKMAVWKVGPAGGTPTQVTGDYDLDGFKVAPTGDKLVVWAARPVGAASLDAKLPAKASDAGSGRTFDQLFIRHWDTWSDHQREQLFVIPIAAGKASGPGHAIEGALIGDTPSKPYGGAEEVSWSRDGKTVYFALREAGRIEALSTNLDIFAAPADGSAPPVNLTVDNKATDTQPAVSPDGRWLAWGAMARPGAESDRLVLWVREIATGKARAVTERWDRSIGSIAWAPNSAALYVTANDVLDNPVFRIDLATGEPHRITGPGHAGGVEVLPGGGLVYTLDSLTAPADIWKWEPNGRTTQLTHVNAARLAGVDWPTVSRFTFKGAGNATVWGIVAKPRTLAPGAKAPIAFLVHGGPQGSFGDSWSYRWNPAAWTGHGYAVVSVDFHGSTGYGQAFTDSISNDWGGKPLTDLKLGLKAATEQFAWLDADNACALGASYGGYMMNWIEGAWPDRFKCIVQHDGVFDARAMAYETEELWFDEWEHGGHPYYEDAAAFEKWNPVNKVAEWKTPQLVITSERDFRIPYTQGIAAFTALQRRDVPSKLLVFPDENHWVLKPKNSLQWYGEVFQWLDKWTGNKAG